MYEGAARVPLIVSDPGGVAGASTDHLVNTPGLHATVLERCGLDRPADPAYCSRSLGPLLSAPDTDDWHEETYAELGDRTMLVRDDRKLVRARDDDGYLLHELYDCSAPVDDGRDLLADAGHAGVGRELAGVLDAWEERAAPGNGPGLARHGPGPSSGPGPGSGPG